MTLCNLQEKDNYSLEREEPMETQSEFNHQCV